VNQRIGSTQLPDGTRIAFAVAGSGPFLLAPPGWVSHVGLSWALPAERGFYEALATGRTLVRYDRPGCGMSERVELPQSLEAEMEVLGTVAGAVGADRFDLFGGSLGAPVAVACDVLCLGLVQLATISERRSERLVNPALSGLPPFLTRHGGLQSGLMMAQVTAAALTSELKTLAHPASADTIPTSGNKEDHVSMSMGAGLKTQRALELAQLVIAVELLCACQAIDLLAPLRTSPPLAQAHDFIRSRVPIVNADRSTSRDLANITRMIASGEVERACATKVN